MPRDCSSRQFETIILLRGEIPEEEYQVPIGKAEIRRSGGDVTVVATSRMVHESLKAAAKLAEEKIEIEVIDLKSISPWDQETVLTSVQKTHRLVVAHEAVRQCGIGAEVAATVAEIGFDELDAPIERVGAPFVPIPFSLEKAYLPASGDVEAAVKRTLDRTL